MLCCGFKTLDKLDKAKEKERKEKKEKSSMRARSNLEEVVACCA